MTGNRSTITIFTPEGEAKTWTRLEVRNAEFLRQYPPTVFAVHSSWTYALDASSGMLEVAKVAAAANADLGNFGLRVDDLKSVIFKAQLLGPNGTILREASAYAIVRENKDWERGETAAYARLLARLGFGGEALDKDEFSDIAEMGGAVGQETTDDTTQPGQEMHTAASVGTTATEPLADDPPNVEQDRSDKPVQKLSHQVRKLVGRKVLEAESLGIDFKEDAPQTDAEAKAFLEKLDQAIQQSGKRSKAKAKQAPEGVNL